VIFIKIDAGSFREILPLVVLRKWTSVDEQDRLPFQGGSRMFNDPAAVFE
jgi:hypothetical protein